MASDKKTLEAVLSGRGTISFREFQRLLLALRFTLARISGSHHVYFHAVVGRPFPIQPDGKDAKRYQVRQLRDMIYKYRLTIDSNT